MTTNAHTTSGTSSFRIPEPTCHTKSRINPEYPMIYEHHAAWSRRLLPFVDAAAMMQFFERRYPMFDALIFPAGLPQRVVHSACMNSLMFEVDDLALRQHAAFNEIVSDRTAGHPYGPAFSDIWQTVEGHMSKRVFRRYRDGWENCFRGILAEREYTGRGILPDFERYLAIRQLSFGFQPLVVCAEYVHGIDLSEVVDVDPDIMRAQRAVCMHALLVNDLLSFRKEFDHGDLFNVVAILAYVHHCPLQEALDITGTLIRDVDAELSRIYGVLRRRYCHIPQIQIYVSALESLCSGNLRWSLETTRYHGPGFGWNGLRSGILTIDPDRPGPKAADIPGSGYECTLRTARLP